MVSMSQYLCASFLRTLWDVVTVDTKARLGSYPMDMWPRLRLMRAWCPSCPPHVALRYDLLQCLDGSLYCKKVLALRIHVL